MVEHGTISAYTNLSCRCAPCKRAWRSYHREARRRRHAAGLPTVDDPRHGTWNGYSNWGCRCAACVMVGYQGRERHAIVKWLAAQGHAPLARAIQYGAHLPKPRP